MKFQYTAGQYHIISKTGESHLLTLTTSEAKFFFKNGLSMKILNLEEIRKCDKFCPYHSPNMDFYDDLTSNPSPKLAHA